MASFVKAGYYSPGQTFTVDGGASPVANTDTLTLNGVKQPISEWIKRGVLKFVSAAVNINTYYVMSNPEIVGTQAGG